MHPLRVALLVAVLIGAVVPVPGGVAASAPVPAIASAVGSLKIMNYYPSAAGWTRMWETYSRSRTQQDFRAIGGLGANTVRVIVQPSAMGFPRVTPARRAAFRDMLDVARTERLGVQLTLFDWWHDYDQVDAAKHWMAQLLAGQAGNPVIRLVELQNEIPTQDRAALAWARALLPELSRLLPGVPRALSASSASGVAGVAALAELPRTELDVLSVHYYGEPAYAVVPLRAALRLGGRPVILGEAGRSTIGGAGGDEAQARFFRQLTLVTRALGLPPAAPWTLDDFRPGAAPAGASPVELAYGLRRVDGSWKPGAQVVREAFSGRVTQDWDGGFEREAAAGAVLGSWSRFSAADGAATVDSSVVRSGRVAMCFTDTSGGPGRVPSVQQTFPLLSGDRQVFRASGFVHRRRATGHERISLAWFGADAAYLGQVESSPATGDGRWELLTVTGRAPAGAVAVQVHLKAGFESGTACYDDVSIG